MLLAGPFLFVLLASVLPEAEGLPDRIGPQAPFTLAGAGVILADILFIVAPTRKRERAIRWGALSGFALGAAIYLLALLARI
jgi:hypothetical protein